MADYTLKIRTLRSRDGRRRPTGQDYTVDLEGHRSVLDGILQAEGPRGRLDRDPLLVPGGDLRLVRRAGQRPGEARLQHQAERRGREAREDGAIVVEPMGNMPVLKDLIVNMDAVHWKKVQRVVPWLLPAGDPPEREYVVPPESMIDVTQSMACIHCGACVSDCLSMEVDPLFIGPAALAKAYRFVGDPRDAQDRGAPARPRRGPARDLRLHPLLQLHRGVPEGRRADGPDHAAAPRARRATSRSTTRTTAAATSRRSRTSSARRASSTSASCSRTASARSARRAAMRS